MGWELVNLSVDSEYVDKRGVILGMTLHFSAQYLEHIEKHILHGQKFLFPKVSCAAGTVIS